MTDRSDPPVLAAIRPQTDEEKTFTRVDRVPSE